MDKNEIKWSKIAWIIFLSVIVLILLVSIKSIRDYVNNTFGNIPYILLAIIIIGGFIYFVLIKPNINQG